MDRYRVTVMANGLRFGILDREQYEFCGLPEEDGSVTLLEWKTRPPAEAWLNQCYRAWKAWEANGKGIAPKGWRPHRPQPSAFDRGFWYYR